MFIPYHTPLHHLLQPFPYHQIQAHLLITIIKVLMGVVVDEGIHPQQMMNEIILRAEIVMEVEEEGQG